MMFLFPPRPEKAISPALIKSYEDQGYIGQRKKNGTLQVVSIDERGWTVFRTRHNEPNKAWEPIPDIRRWFSGFPDSVFVGELLHSKGPSVKNTIVIFDVLRYLGTDMVGTTLEARLDILASIHPWSKSIQIIETYRKDLTGLYNSLADPLDEGIVLKNPLALLRNCQRAGLNSGWQVKARKGHKNYSF